MERFSVGSAAMKLTLKILGHKTDELTDILKELTSELNVDHIAYVRMSSKKSLDSSLIASSVTYPKEWQRRYFFKQYFLIDPILNYGAHTSLSHFDWEQAAESVDAPISEFFSDAARHQVGSNGISVIVRNRRHSYAIVSYTSNIGRDEWKLFKDSNLTKLYHASALIDAAAMAGSKLPEVADISLSLREEQCLIWAAAGKTYEEIGQITNLSYYSVRSHLDVARHKLHGANLTHAVAIAVAMGVISPQAIRETA